LATDNEIDLEVPAIVTPILVDGSEKISKAYARDARPPHLLDPLVDNRVQVKFTLIKEIDFTSEEKCKRVMGDLKKLYLDDFGKIKIPHFVFKTLNEKTIQIKCEYIKGRYPRLNEMNIVRDYALLRINDKENPYTLADYHPNNYIVEQVPPHNIYCIDLDCYTKADMARREELWQAAVGPQERYNKHYSFLK